MAWIPDVAPRQTISSSQWGNPMRDRVVHQYANLAERNAASNAGHAVDGMQAWAQAEDTLAVWISGPGWVVLYQPWQPWTPTARFDPATPVTVQTDIAEYRRSADLVTVRFLIKAINPGSVPGVVRFSIPVANAAPHGFPYGAGAAATFGTGQTFGVSFVVENSSMYARKMSDWTAISLPVGGPWGDVAFEGMYSYRAAALN